MTHNWKMAVCLAGGLVFNTGLRAGDVAPSGSVQTVSAATAGNPYDLIVTRNVFSLLPPPPPPDPNPPAPEPAVKITLTGIMSVMNQQQALYKTSGGGKPGEQSYMLAEGQSLVSTQVSWGLHGGWG
jgi:hypothetical protein